jgi:hypothetical protein
MTEIFFNHADQKVHEQLPLATRDRRQDAVVDSAQCWPQAGMKLLALCGQAEKTHASVGSVHLPGDDVHLHQVFDHQTRSISIDVDPIGEDILLDAVSTYPRKMDHHPRLQGRKAEFADHFGGPGRAYLMEAPGHGGWYSVPHWRDTVRGQRPLPSMGAIIHLHAIPSCLMIVMLHEYIRHDI